MANTRLCAGFLLTFLVAGTALAQPTAAPDVSAKVDAIFKDYTKSGSPGCALGVYQDDRVVYSRAFGMANLDHDVPLTPASVFHVASVSKQFTAAAILLLAQDGRLSLDDEVRKHVPELPAFGPKITIRHLVHHTSGIRDQWALLTLAGWRYSRDLITDDDVLSLLSRQKELNFTPGERHLYSNSGYTLLAIIVSRVSGKTFRQFTTERIFAPLGMTRTHFRDDFNEIVKNQAYGYAPQGTSFRLSVTNFDTAGATSLLTTVEDLAKWFANFDRKIVGGDQLIPAMLERGTLNSGEKIDYAFGIGHGTYRGAPTLSHSGGDAGYRAFFVRFPEQRFGLSILCNLASTNPGMLAMRVADVYLGDLLKPRVTAPDSTNEPEVPLPQDQLSRLAGLYWNAPEAAAARFSVENGRLHIGVGGTHEPLKSLGNGRFVRASGQGPRYTFDLTTGGRVTVGTGTALQRVPAWTPDASDLQAFAGAYRSEEIELVYRVSLKDATLRVERLKSQPVPLEPLLTDVFRAPFGIVRFSRNASGVVTGFAIDSGRIRGLRFAIDAAATRPSSAER